MRNETADAETITAHTRQISAAKPIE